MEKINFDELFKLANEKKFKVLKEKLINFNNVDIASFVEELKSENITPVFRSLPKDTAADVFSYLSAEMQEHILNSITDQELTNIIEDLFVDDVVDFLEEMPASVVKKVLKNASDDTRALINQFLKYPDDSAGSIMTTEFIELRKNMTVIEAISQIRKTAIDKETIYTCFVTNESRLLEGIISVKRLLLCNDDDIISDVMNKNIISVVTTDDQELVAQLFSKYNLLSMPVVDNENLLVGIVTVDDVVDVINEEATEDFQIMAAMLPSEKPYFKTSVFTMAKKRTPWILVLMVSAIVIGGIIEYYENAISALPILVSFIPMLMDTGGNAGSQSSTLIIRGMALSEIKLKDFHRVLWKEFRVSLIVGSALAALNFIRIMIMYNNDVYLAFVVAVTLLSTVIMAKTIGGMLPILAKLCRTDPAVMSSPVITTIVDASALIIYFYFIEMLII